MKEEINLPYEESYLGFSIFIEKGPDPLLEEFGWSVCKNENEYDSGYDFTVQDALSSARARAAKLNEGELT